MNSPRRALRPYLFSALLILVVAAFFRLWQLDSAPPGLSVAELQNAQLADRMRLGDVAVVYDDLTPGRSGLYHALLAFMTTFTGRGLVLWRLPSIWLSLMSLSMTFTLMRRLFNGRVALMVMAYLAVSFWPVWLGRAVLEVTLVPLFTASFCYALVRGFTARDTLDAGLWFTLGGLVLGLAQYAHVMTWVYLPIMLAFMGILSLTHRETVRRERINVFFTLALAGVTFIPMLIFMLANPGVRAAVPLADQPDWLAEIPNRLGRTLGGLALRGDISAERNLPLRAALEPVTSILALVGAGITLTRWRKASYALLPVWFIIGLIPALLVPHTPNFEYMALLVPVLYAFPALALDEIRATINASQRPALLRLRVYVMPLIGMLFVFNAAWTFRDHFFEWPTNQFTQRAFQSDVAALAHYLDTSPDDSPLGLCVIPVHAETLAADPFALTSDARLSYFMHRDLHLRTFDCRQALVLAAGDGTQRLIFMDAPPHTSLPGMLLAWLRDGERLTIPGVADGTVWRLDAISSREASLAWRNSVSWPPEASGGPGPAQLPATFTEGVRLDGYQVRDSILLSQETLEMVTYWQVVEPTTQQLALSVNLQSGPGQLAASSEGWGVDLASIQPGDVIVQFNALRPVDDNALQAGTYTLAIGLSVPGTDHSLRILDGETPRSIRLIFVPVNVIK